MLEVSVKTLDGTNRTFSLEDEITVKEFKEKISGSINIALDRQRLIFQGRVLQDDKKLSEYNVNGKVIHVVERPPPDMRRAAGAERAPRSGHAPGGGGVSIDAFSLPEMVDPNHIQNLVQQTLSGMGDLGRNARVTSRTSSDGSAVDVHINLTRHGAQVSSESQQRILHAHRLLAHVNYTLDQLQNPESGSDVTAPVYEANGTAPVNPDLATPISMSQPDSSDTPTDNQTTPTDGQTTPTSSTTPGGVSGTNSAGGATKSPETSSTSTEAQTSSSQQSTNLPSTSGAANSRNEEHPETRELAGLLDKLKEVERRLEPYRDQYHQLMVDDPQLDEQGRGESQRLFNYVSSCLHHLAHVNHHISDLMVDFNTQRPRRIRAAANPPPAPTAVIHQTIPVQAQVSLISARPIRSARSRSRGRANNRTANQSAQVTTNIPLSATQPTTSTSTSGSTSTSTNSTNSTTSTGTSTDNRVPQGMFGFPPVSGAPPMMFMELGPNSLSVNSISTHVVREGEEGAPGMTQGHPLFGVPRAGAPNMDFMNNLMRMASQRMSAPRGPMAPPPAPSSTPAQPASGSATPPQTPPSEHAHSGEEAGRLPPIVQMDNRSVDPFMICNSRHYQPMRMHPQRQNGEAAVNEVVNSLINSLVQGNNPETSPSSQPAPETGSVPAAQGTPNFLDSLRTFLRQNPSSASGGSSGGSSAASGGSSGSSGGSVGPSGGSGGSSGSSGGSGGQMSDEMFLEMVSGISSSLMTSPGQAQSSILDFLSRIDPNHRAGMGEGIINDFYVVLSRDLTFPDIIQLMTGVPEPLNRLRPTLQRFINDKILCGEEGSEENIDRAIERIAEEENFLGSITDVCRESGVEVRAGIDFPATLMSLLEHQLRTIIHIIVEEDDRPGFDQRLFDQCRTALHELIVLTRRCLTQGMDGVDQLVRNRVNNACLGVSNPMIRNWLVNTSQMNLRALTPQITLTERDVQHYITSTRQTSTPLHERMEVDGTPSPQVVPEVSPGEPISAHSDSDESFVDAVGTMGPGDEGAPGEESAPSESSMETESGGASREVPDWRSVLPQEWVPVIERDSEQQRSQTVRQAPFSDAYMNGMPAKRRKVMTAENSLVAPGDRDLGSIINHSVRDAMRLTGIRPLTSLDALQRDISVETDQLTAAYQQQVIEDIQNRLSEDPDFSSERFPNTDRYFKGKR